MRDELVKDDIDGKIACVKTLVHYLTRPVWVVLTG